jgi:hypothetical protein
MAWAQSFEGAPDAFDIAWSADGTFLAASGAYGKVAVWDESSGHQQSFVSGA